MSLTYCLSLDFPVPVIVYSLQQLKICNVSWWQEELRTCPYKEGGDSQGSFRRSQGKNLLSHQRVSTTANQITPFHFNQRPTLVQIAAINSCHTQQP